MGKWLVTCLDAKYDYQDEMMVLNCEFKEEGFKRIICFSRKDFTFNGQNEVPHEEMIKTAELFKHKTFWFEMHDDPNLEKITQENTEKYSRLFTKEIGSHMDSVVEGLLDSDRRVARKLADIVTKDQKRQKDASEILAEEMSIRDKLGSIIKDK